jgi:hypothetical protein
MCYFYISLSSFVKLVMSSYVTFACSLLPPSLGCLGAGILSSLRCPGNVPFAIPQMAVLANSSSKQVAMNP